MQQKNVDKDFALALSRAVLCFDGGFGTQAAARGLRTACPELLNQTDAEAVIDIHRAYVEAGAQVIETNSLGTNAYKLAEHDLALQVEPLATAAVQNAKDAAMDRAWVAYSLGTTGQFLAPLGPLSMEEAIAAYRLPLQAAKAAGADLCICETMTDIGDMRAALLAARAAKLPAIASYTFEESGRLLSGGTPECAALAAQALGAIALGINCSTGPEAMLPTLRAMRSVSSLPVVVQPNAGLPQLTSSGETVFPLSPADMVPAMEALLDTGAAAIGGCCGTTPDHIRSFAKLTQGKKSPAPLAVEQDLIASQRTWMPLASALSSLFPLVLESADPSPLYTAPEACEALLLDCEALSPQDILDLVPMAQMATSKPFLFRVTKEETLNACLLQYHGRCAVFAPKALFPSIRAMGALPLSEGMLPV